MLHKVFVIIFVSILYQTETETEVFYLVEIDEKIKELNSTVFTM